MAGASQKVIINYSLSLEITTIIDTGYCMKHRILILLEAIVLSMFNYSCSNNVRFYQVDEIVSYEIGNNLDTLQGELVYQPDDQMGLCGLECIDSLVVLFSNKDDSLVLIYDIPKDSIIAHLGRYGNARNELLGSIRYCQMDHDGDGNVIMHIQDENRMKMINYNLTKSIRDNGLVYSNSFEYSLDNSNVDRYRCYAVGGNDYILHKGISGDGDVRDGFSNPPCVITTKENKQVMSVYPQIVSGDDRYLRYAYNIMSQIKPDHSKIVEVHGNIGLFTIIDLVSHKTIGVKNEASYDFNHIDNLGKIKDDSKFDKLFIYNTCCNVSDDYIVICQDGQLSMSEYEKVFMYKPTISVFNWEGQLLGSFAVREPIAGVAIAQEGKCLYGLGMDNCLYKYNLSKCI